ncbi:hypothetical protein [Luteolibacter sp. AS25]|uniref:hypothetical protein n=1 Tax=Luteolibacter sp. AS25 TaxID=3135776 RepID=UPI00398AB05D
MEIEQTLYDAYRSKKAQREQDPYQWTSILYQSCRLPRSQNHSASKLALQGSF